MKAQTVGKSILKTGLAARVFLTSLSSAAGISVNDDGVSTNRSPHRNLFSFIRRGRKLIAHLVTSTIFLSVLGNPAYSASVDLDQYQALLDLAGKKEYVRVLVNLDLDVPLDPAHRMTSPIQAKLLSKEKALVIELDDQALKTGARSNGLGQIVLYVTAEGVTRIANSTNVRWFGLDLADGIGVGVFDGDYWLSEIEHEIEKNGFADVEVTLNLENFDFEIKADGNILYKQSKEQLSELQEKLPKFLGTLPRNGVHGLESLVTNSKSIALSHSGLPLRIYKEGYFALKEHGDVRAIRLAGTPPSQPTEYDEDVLEMARKQGYADVIIDLHIPHAYSPLEGKLPAKAWKSQASAIRRAFVDILSGLEPSAVKLAQDFNGIPSSSVRLSIGAIEKLYSHRDARIRHIALNKVTAFPALAESTALVNMPQAWNKGYTAAGQTIAIFDTGIDRPHPFLQTDAGQSKISVEACFGASQGSGATTMCPNADIFGDSQWGMPGSSNSCSYYSSCGHGTQVAGIAAGKRGWNGLSGMAPDANIMGIKIFSRLQDGTIGPLDEDIVASLTALANYAKSGEITANFSIASGLFNSTCSGRSTGFNAAVARLLSLKIPVVVATGNDGSRGNISWPACAPKVIKVAGIYDTNNQIWGNSNIINPALVDGPIFFAPGCAITTANPTNLGGGTIIVSCGTSMAAPHVAGLYAAIKAASPGISVEDATRWIQANGVDIPVFGLGYTIKRINVPSNL